MENDFYKHYHYNVGDINCIHPLGKHIIVPHPDKSRKFQLLKEFSIIGNPESLASGKQIGDLFTGVLSTISFKNKFNLLKDETYISVPEFRYNLVNFFKNANCVPVTSEFFVDIHVNSLTRKNGNILYDYFNALDIEQNEIFNNFYFDSGEINEEVGEDDIIIFPITSGDDIIDYNLFLEFIKEKQIKYRKIFWNAEPNKIYRKNYDDSMDTINLEIDDLLKTVKEKNPTIIGHRSGIFDIIFHMIPKSKTYCFYRKDNQLQSEWNFKSKNLKYYEKYKDYIESRENFNEIFI